MNARSVEGDAPLAERFRRDLRGAEATFESALASYKATKRDPSELPGIVDLADRKVRDALEDLRALAQRCLDRAPERRAADAAYTKSEKRLAKVASERTVQ